MSNLQYVYVFRLMICGIAMKFSSQHQSNLLELLQWRRDVRHFSTEPIDPELLAKLEASVDLSPSVGNSRPWRIVRVSDENNRSAVISSFEEQNREASQIYEDKARQEYLALKLAGLKEAPVHLAFFTEPDPAEGRGLGRQTMPETLVYSTIMAIYTFWLTARSLNIGVGWVSIIDPDKIKKILEVNENWQLTAYLCVGYPKADDDTPELHRAGWQEDTPSVWIDR